MRPTRAAAIAVGSNSTRMLTADLDGRLSDPVRAREETALFLCADKSRRISGEGIEKTARAVSLLKKKAAEAGAGEFHLYATSAARDADNASSLKQAVRAACGLRLRVISGGEEALLSFLGATCLSQGEGRRGVIDIGGGSAEVVTGTPDGIEALFSLQLGAARLYEGAPVDSPGDLPRARQAAESALSRELPLSFPLPEDWTLVGGTGTALARICLGLPHPRPFPEGFAVSAGEALELLNAVAALPPARRAEIPGLPPGREHILPTGLVILTALMDRLRIPLVRVTERNNTDGFLWRLSRQRARGSRRARSPSGAPLGGACPPDG